MELSGYKLSLFRMADRLGVWRLRLWCYGRLLRRFPSPLAFFDPLDATHTLHAMAGRIAAQESDRIEIGANEFRKWVSQEMRDRADFNAPGCFHRLMRSIGDRTRYTSGDHGVDFFVSPGICNVIVVDIVRRRDVSPTLTRGQYLKLNQLLFKAPRIDQEVIATAWAEALSRDWPWPFDEPAADPPPDAASE